MKRRRVLQLSISHSIVKHSSRMLAIQGWSVNIIIAATGTTVILMLLFLCLKSSQTNKKPEVAECQGSSDICEKMTRMWTWTLPPTSPDQSLIGTYSAKEHEEDTEKSKVTSVSVQIPPIYQEGEEAEQYMNQYKFERNMEDKCVYKIANNQIENIGDLEDFIYPLILKEKSSEHTKLNNSPNSHVKLNNSHSKNVNCCFCNSKHRYKNVPYPSTNKENKFLKQKRIPEQLHRKQPQQIKIDNSDKRTYEPINDNSLKQSNAMPIPQNSVMPKPVLEESVATYENNNYQVVPVEFIQKKEPHVCYFEKKRIREDPPPRVSQFKEGITTENNTLHQSQIQHYPSKLRYNDKQGCSQPIPMDVKKQNYIRSSSKENPDPNKFISRSVSDEILATNSISKKGSYISPENLTAVDILDISTSSHKSASLSDVVGYISLGSLRSNEKSKERIVRQLSDFTSLFPEDPKNPIPKDPLRLPVSQNYEMMRMSRTQLSEKISEIGSKTAAEGTLLKTGNKTSNQAYVPKFHRIFNFRTSNTGNKSNDNTTLNRDSVSTDSSKSDESIEINIHHREVPRTKKFSDSNEDMSENEYNIRIPRESTTNKGKKHHSLTIICGRTDTEGNFNNKDFNDAITKPTLHTKQRNVNQSELISNKTLKCTPKNLNTIERNPIQALPPKIVHSEELCCLHFSNSPNVLPDSRFPSFVTNNVFQQQDENLDNELKSNYSVQTSDSADFKETIVFYNQHFTKSASSDILNQNIPGTGHHEQTLLNISTPEMIQERQCNSASTRCNYDSNINNEVITTKRPLKNDETKNLHKIAYALKWRIVLEKSNLTK